MQHLIYLHGFLSSPKSAKALMTQAYLTKHYPSINFHCPQLSGDINKVLSQVRALVCSLPQRELRFIGSSMGGFLSTYLVEEFSGKAVLVNPAVRPHELLRNYLGKHINPYSGEEFYVHDAHLTTLRQCDKTDLRSPDNYMVLLQTGDETLDYRIAQRQYARSHLVVEKGGSHAFEHYARHLPNIVSFLRG